MDPDGAKTTTTAWAARWVEALNVETRTEENYRAYLRNHILLRWGTTPLGAISALEVTAWVKDLRQRYAASTVSGIVTVFSMMLDDAVDEHLIPVSPVHRRRRRGRRRDHAPLRNERVWAMPEHVLRIADQGRTLGSPSAALLIITAACTLARTRGRERDTVSSTRPCGPVYRRRTRRHRMSTTRLNLFLVTPEATKSVRLVGRPGDEADHV